MSLLTDRIDAALLDAAPRLKVVSNYAVGFNNVDMPAATARGVAVGNTPGVLTDATADMAFCLLIAAARRARRRPPIRQAGQWKTWEPLGHLGQDLAGRTLGVVGMGRIGYALARRCHVGWDMKVLYHDIYRNEKAETDLDARQVDLDTLLRESDFVSVHTDLNEKTRGLFNRAQFRKMKPTAVFVNTARGPIVDETDLIEALKTGAIFAAGLDVTDPEPPAPNSPLLHAAEPGRRAAHRQRHGRHAQRDGRHLREQPAGRTERRNAAGVGQPGGRAETPEMNRDRLNERLKSGCVSCASLAPFTGLSAQRYRPAVYGG